jgi:cytoskeletal protein CcmA (bactofilin family)
MFERRELRMTWLGQKPDPEPTRTIPTATAVASPVAPHPIPVQSVERMATPKMASIGKSLHVKGELSGSEDLAIEGRVDGTINLNGYSVTIGQTGRVAAEIHAKSVVVGGLVNGDINAVERVEVAATGTMVGDVRAPRVVLVDGARFKGSIDMATGDPSNSREATPAHASFTRV